MPKILTGQLELFTRPNPRTCKHGYVDDNGYVHSVCVRCGALYVHEKHKQLLDKEVIRRDIHAK